MLFRSDRYSLVILTAKRARQIIDGSNPQVETDSNKPLTIAINEVNNNSIKFEVVGEGLK